MRLWWDLTPFLFFFFHTAHLLPFTEADGLVVAKLRAELHRLGTPIGPFDLLLAGTALHHRLTFVTSNIREFERVKGLVVEDWRENLLREV